MSRLSWQQSPWGSLRLAQSNSLSRQGIGLPNHRMGAPQAEESLGPLAGGAEPHTPLGFKEAMGSLPADYPRHTITHRPSVAAADAGGRKGGGGGPGRGWGWGGELA